MKPAHALSPWWKLRHIPPPPPTCCILTSFAGEKSDLSGWGIPGLETDTSEHHLPLFYGYFICTCPLYEKPNECVCLPALMLPEQVPVVIRAERLGCRVGPASNRRGLFLGKSVLGLPFLYQKTGHHSQVISRAVTLLGPSNKLIFTSTQFITYYTETVEAFLGGGDKKQTLIRCFP